MSAEAPIRAQSPEELVYLLSQASELEHGLMCEYLFAMFSLKRQAKEGPSADQLEAAGRWDRMISRVAAQEMLHLALVSNLLTAVGAVPHFERPNFPQQAKYYPPGVQLALVPFGERALRHFLYLERPEGTELAYLLPHRHAAWVVLHERLTGLAEACAAVAEETGHEALATAEGNLRSLAGLLAPGI